jgi:hypothetical protein
MSTKTMNHQQWWPRIPATISSCGLSGTLKARWDAMYTGHGKRAAFLTVSLLLSACGGGGGGGTVPTTRPAPIEIVQTIEATGPGKQVSYVWNGGFSNISPTEDAAARAIFMFDANDKLAVLTIQTTTATSAPTTTKIDFVGSDIKPLGPDFWVAANPASKAIISNPLSSAWNFQSFGVWESGLNAGGGHYGAMSVGETSPVSAIPLAQGATFKGTAIGSYVTGGIGHAVLADLTVLFDSSGQLTFTTSGTRYAENISQPYLPGLDMTNQTLTYSPGTSGFSGDLTTPSGLSGQSTGQFYGTDATELGGVFFLRSAPDNPVETYSGAYGASR